MYYICTFKISTMYKMKWLSLFKKNVLFWSNKPISLKGVSDLETCMDYFVLLRRVVKIWIFLSICIKWHTTEKNLAYSKKNKNCTGLSVIMPNLNFSKLLLGSTKCFIHVSKSETPLQNQYVLYWIEIDLKLIVTRFVTTVHTTYFSHGLFYRKSCQRIVS